MMASRARGSSQAPMTSAGDDDADQSLGENAERGERIGRDKRAAARPAAFRRQHRIRRAQDGAGDAGRHQHVEVGELRAAEEERRGGEHQQR